MRSSHSSRARVVAILMVMSAGVCAAALPTAFPDASPTRQFVICVVPVIIIAVIIGALSWRFWHAGDHLQHGPSSSP